MTRVLVTGHSGFIGNRLLETLPPEGIEIMTLPETLDLSLGPPRLPEAGIDGVVHLAALTPHTGRPKTEILDSNIRITLNLLAALEGNAPRIFVYLNTNVYGIPAYLPVDEEHPVQPASLYHASKYIGEKLIKDFGRRRRCRTVSLRLFNPYGPGQKKPFLIPSIIASLRENRPIELKEPQSKRDYIFIDDVCSAIARALFSDTAAGAVYNIASGVASSNLDIARRLRDVGGIDVPISEMPGGGGAYEVRADIGKAERELRWLPRIDLGEGLRKTWEKETHAR